MTWWWWKASKKRVLASLCKQLEDAGRREALELAPELIEQIEREYEARLKRERDGVPAPAGDAPAPSTEPPAPGADVSGNSF